MPVPRSRPNCCRQVQVQHRQTINNDKVLPGYFSATTENLLGNPVTVTRTSTPFIGSLINMIGGEFIDEITFGTHDFNAVITRIPGQPGCTNKGLYLLLNTLGGQGFWLERCNG